MNYFEFSKKVINIMKKFGYFNFIKIIIFEILNFKFDKIYEYKVEKPYLITSEPYVSCFYYALWDIKNRINLSKKIFIDFGSGKGRVLRYFSNNTKEIIGIEINDKYMKYMSENLINKIFWKDAYDNSFVESIIDKYTGKELVIFFYHPFEQRRINEIIFKFINSIDNLIIVLVGDIELNSQNKKLCFNIYKNGRLTKIFSTKKKEDKKLTQTTKTDYEEPKVGPLF